MGEPLTVEAFRAMLEKLRPKPTTPIEEAMDQKPVLILSADIDGFVALRIAPGKAVFLACNPVEIAGKLRREGFVVATGQDARELLTLTLLGHAPGFPMSPEVRYAVWHLQAIDKARGEIEVLRDIVGAEQVERALWWAGPSQARLEIARSYLHEGRTIDEDGQWSPASTHLLAGEVADKAAFVNQMLAAATGRRTA